MAFLSLGAAYLAARFAGLGIGAERLELRGGSSHHATLEQYGDVDVALDPFPFSGGLTSCDALWMGVPVVTLPGDAPQSRQTAGLLGAIGIAGWVARSPDEYVSIALQLLSDPERLRRTRHTLRDRMAGSSLCDAASFTHGLEAAFRTMWRGWCDERRGTTTTRAGPAFS